MYRTCPYCGAKHSAYMLFLHLQKDHRAELTQPEYERVWGPVGEEV